MLPWLPAPSDWAGGLRALEADGLPWAALSQAARQSLDFMQTDRLDRLLRRGHPSPPAALGTRPVRVAILGSSTLGHLSAGIRVGCLRRGMWAEVLEGDYDGYRRDLTDPQSWLARARPDWVLLALDARHVTAGLRPGMDAAAAREAMQAVTAQLVACWTGARRHFGARVIQQTVLPVLPAVLGESEQRLAASPAAFVARLNARLRELAEEHDVALLAADHWAAQDGVSVWHDPVLWHRAKQEISPVAAPFYGDLVARILAAGQGRSAKCLVLDLDNTVWGGVVGDDGLEGIVIGQGSAGGEAFVAVQTYAKHLAARGVILAVCSKNDHANAIAPFERHPDMVLRPGDVSCFVANWDDKASNLRRIARELNIGIDSLVFLDDNPFERGLVRSTIPEVAVPDVPDDDPALVPGMLARAGYFEALAVTDEDRARAGQYQANRERAALEAEATDMPAYLRSLDMRLACRPFDGIGLQRIVQLINKTNQFNLTTRRYTDAEVRAVMDAPDAFGLQLRLLDRFGDNGMIAVVIGRVAGGDCTVDTWLMSCRVLKREVEEATLNLLAAEAAARGATRLVGEYRPTAKNGMVAGHYPQLGFAPAGGDGDVRRFVLDLSGYRPRPVVMTVTTGE